MATEDDSVWNVFFNYEYNVKKVQTVFVYTIKVNSVQNNFDNFDSS